MVSSVKAFQPKFCILISFMRATCSAHIILHLVKCTSQSQVQTVTNYSRWFWLFLKLGAKPGTRPPFGACTRPENYVLTHLSVMFLSLYWYFAYIWLYLFFFRISTTVPLPPYLSFFLLYISFPVDIFKLDTSTRHVINYKHRRSLTKCKVPRKLLEWGLDV